MGNFSAKGKKAIGHSSTFASKALVKPVHPTPLKQEAPKVIADVLDINLDKITHELFKDLDFNIKPGIIGTLLPPAEMWGRNKKIARLQEYTQRGLAVINDLKALAEQQQELRAKRTVDYEVMTLKVSLARAKQEILILESSNNAMIQDVNERITRMEREGMELRQKLDIERESHEISMEERRLQIRIKELQAKLLEQQLEE